MTDSERETRISTVISEITALLPRFDQLDINLKFKYEELSNEII